MSFGSLPGGRTLFLDLDGVMADFDGGFPAKFGYDHRAVPDEVMWAEIEKDGKFFRELPPCAGALEFFSRARWYSPVILTACPADKFSDVAEQKRAWVRKWLGSQVPIVFTVGGKTKQLYMHKPGDILIDDFPRNVERWNKAGGEGILHLGDFKATAQNLAGALWPTSHLALATSPAPSADRETTSPGTMTDTPIASAKDASTASPPGDCHGQPLRDMQGRPIC